MPRLGHDRVGPVRVLDSKVLVRWHRERAEARIVNRHEEATEGNCGYGLRPVARDGAMRGPERGWYLGSSDLPKAVPGPADPSRSRNAILFKCLRCRTGDQAPYSHGADSYINNLRIELSPL